MDYTNVSNLDDNSLGQLIANGNELAMVAYRNRHERKIYYRAYRILHSSDQAEWVVAESLSKAFSKAAEWTGVGVFSAWVSGIVRYRIAEVARDVGRNKRLRPFHFVVRNQDENGDDYDDLDHVECPRGDALDAIVLKEETRITEDAINDALLKLTSLQRISIILTGEGYEPAEIARILGKSKCAMHAIRDRARRRLRVLLADMFK